MSIEHNHKIDTVYHPHCPRCKLNEAAPALLDNLKKTNQELTRCRRTPDYAQRQKGLISALQNELEAVIALAEKEG